jgi:hypothetical protein
MEMGGEVGGEWGVSGCLGRWCLGSWACGLVAVWIWEGGVEVEVAELRNEIG